MTVCVWIALENRDLNVQCILYWRLLLCLQIPEFLRFIHGSCMLSFLHLQPFSYAEASCLCLLLFWRADILLEYQSQLHICLKDYPLSFLCTHCDCHNGKLENDTRVFLSPQPGTLNQAIKDIEALVDKEVDGSIHSIWLMAEWVHETMFCSSTVLCSCHLTV